MIKPTRFKIACYGYDHWIKPNIPDICLKQWHNGRLCIGLPTKPLANPYGHNNFAEYTYLKES